MQKISKRTIVKTVKRLPRGYISKLSLMVYKSTDPTCLRRIKYWRSGQMKTYAETARIYNAALKLIEITYEATDGELYEGPTATKAGDVDLDHGREKDRKESENRTVAA